MELNVEMKSFAYLRNVSICHPLELLHAHLVGMMKCVQAFGCATILICVLVLLDILEVIVAKSSILLVSRATMTTKLAHAAIAAGITVSLFVLIGGGITVALAILAVLIKKKSTTSLNAEKKKNKKPSVELKTIHSDNGSKDDSFMNENNVYNSSPRRLHSRDHPSHRPPPPPSSTSQISNQTKLSTKPPPSSRAPSQPPKKKPMPSTAHISHGPKPSKLAVQWPPNSH